MSIKNKTRKPLKVPLPGGKRLFLGPGKTGQITAQAASHPPLVALIEAGELELLDAGFGSGGRKQKGASPSAAGQPRIASKAVFRSGDG